MKLTKLTLIALIALIGAACSSTKKSSTSSAASTTTITPPPASTTPLIFAKPADGIYAPGEEELAAIQIQYKDVTLEKLKEGHLLYTKGACINCHGAVNIYQFDVMQWKTIIDNMAPKAYLSEMQKDAVYKYVLAIKAKQAK